MVVPIYNSLVTLNARAMNCELADMHPTSTHIELFCSVYFENVDPFIKILHKSCFLSDLAPYLQGHLDHSARFEALLLAVYGLAAMSMSDRDIISHFPGEIKLMSMNRFQTSTEISLASSHFLQSHSLLSLQAFLLYLVRLLRQHTALTGDIQT